MVNEITVSVKPDIDYMQFLRINDASGLEQLLSSWNLPDLVFLTHAKPFYTYWTVIFYVLFPISLKDSSATIFPVKPGIATHPDDFVKRRPGWTHK
jgi:hypothetical protein